jgi:hypothetical protein
MKNTIFSLFNAFADQWGPRQDTTVVPMIQAQMCQLINGIEGEESGWLRQRITTRWHAVDLWLLRADIYQLLSRAHNQCYAQQQVNRLTPLFESVLPPHMLANI